MKPFSESGTSPPTRAKVTSVQVLPGAMISTGRALDETGQPLVFAGDWRTMLAIAEALEAGEEVQVYLEDRQIVAWRRS